MKPEMIDGVPYTKGTPLQAARKKSREARVDNRSREADNIMFLQYKWELSKKLYWWKKLIYQHLMEKYAKRVAEADQKKKLLDLERETILKAYQFTKKP